MKQYSSAEPRTKFGRLVIVSEIPVGYLLSVHREKYFVLRLLSETMLTKFHILGFYIVGAVCN